VRSLTFGAYLTRQWLPSKNLHLATSTYRGYERNVKLHVLPALGRIPTVEAWHPSPCTPQHLIIRGSLDDAVRRGLVSRNVAALARAPKQR
jgi:Phage integrase, N-terminal SAM-like domain